MTSDGKNNRDVSRRARTLQRKIAVIISTDFLCWVPFIIICILHFSETVDATRYYGLFSIVVLPINSLFNPLIYDNTFTRIWEKLRRGGANIIARLSARRDPDNVSDPNIEMHQIPNDICTSNTVIAEE